jgi:hypothetical protein
MNKQRKKALNEQTNKEIETYTNTTAFLPKTESLSDRKLE